jgi:hypothetical protein
MYKKGTVAPLVVDTLEPTTCASPSLKMQIDRIASMSHLSIPDAFPDTCESEPIRQPLEFVIPEMPDSPAPVESVVPVESVPVESVVPVVPAVKRAQTFTFVIDEKKRDRSSCSICAWSDETEEHKSLYKMMKEMML